MTLLMDNANSPPLSLQRTINRPRKVNRRASIGTEISTLSKQSRRRKLEQPITFFELLNRNEFTSSLQQKSCIKTENSTDESKKQVRFATNALNRKVWAHVREVDKVPEEKHPKLWFSEEEFQQTVEDAVGEAISEKSHQDEYVDSFNKFFKSVKNNNNASEEVLSRCMKAVSTCEKARGLEMHIVAKARDYAQKHRESVLEAQDILRQNGLQKCKKGRALICQESIKYSTPSQLIATQLALYDYQEATKASSTRWKKASRRSTMT